MEVGEISIVNMASAAWDEDSLAMGELQKTQLFWVLVMEPVHKECSHVLSLFFHQRIDGFQDLIYQLEVPDDMLAFGPQSKAFDVGCVGCLPAGRQLPGYLFLHKEPNRGLCKSPGVDNLQVYLRVHEDSEALFHYSSWPQPILNVELEPLSDELLYLRPRPYDVENDASLGRLGELLENRCPHAPAVG